MEEHPTSRLITLHGGLDLTFHDIQERFFPELKGGLHAEVHFILDESGVQIACHDVDVDFVMSVVRRKLGLSLLEIERVDYDDLYGNDDDYVDEDDFF